MAVTLGFAFQAVAWKLCFCNKSPLSGDFCGWGCAEHESKFFQTCGAVQNLRKTRTWLNMSYRHFPGRRCVEVSKLDFRGRSKGLDCETGWQGCRVFALVRLPSTVRNASFGDFDA